MSDYRIRRLAMVAFFLLCAGRGLVTAGEPVRVEIWEGLPSPWIWDGKSPEAPAVRTEKYETPALGFVRVPTKYNERGIEIDRDIPYALRAYTSIKTPPGVHRLVLRAKGAAWLLIDDDLIAETDPLRANGSAHEHVPEVAPPEDSRWRYVGPGDQERIVVWESDGKPHHVTLWTIIGHKNLRPETGELSVSLVGADGLPMLIGEERVALTDEGWTDFALAEENRLTAIDTQRRRDAARSDDPYWRMRHELARREAEKIAVNVPPGDGNIIDRFVRASLDERGLTLSPPTDDTSFFRRLSLDTIGVIPEANEVEAFLNDPRLDKRARAIEQRLADSRWADGWMGYWLDVLAENPGILKPTLNNTGPFRDYLHTSFIDNTSFDRFVTELIRMDGSALGGGPAGFGIASENDAPMAAKAHILAKAFLAADMKCARCHDAPFHPYQQEDLFGLAGMLTGQPVTIPATSTVKRQQGGRVPAVSVSLEAGDRVEPEWNLSGISPADLPDDLQPGAMNSSRERLALLITAPSNRRFAPVIVNRLWKRYMGIGLVEPVDDWDGTITETHPALLSALSRELLLHDYDLKHVARLILNSRLYQADVVVAGASVERRPPLIAPAHRSMSAEQLLDSLFAAAGKPFHAEDLCIDPEGRRPIKEMLNLGTPRRAWQFTSTSNERDRPALALPVVQSLVDVLQTFGWRPSRQEPITVRDETTTPLQPALLANGVVVSGRIARLSDDSALTELCLKDQPLEDLIRDIFMRILSRPPSATETALFAKYLRETYPDRIVPGAKPNPPRHFTRRVSWANHLSPEATEIQQERERAVREGDPPTNRLTPGFRERMEDVVWALVNSPEFRFLP